MTEDRDRKIPLNELDPTAEPVRFDRTVGRIMEAARFELARRRKQVAMLVELGRWRKPMAAAAALAVIISYSVVSGRPQTGSEFETAEAYLGLPTAVADWVAEEETPSAREVLFLPAEEEEAP